MSIVIVLFIVGIFITLGSAFFAMTKGGVVNSDKMLKSLQIRVGLSLFLFALLLFASMMGWIEINHA